MNRWTTAVFAPILIVVGIAGFVQPASRSRTSTAPPYNTFHIVFGIIGTIIALSGSSAAIRTFNIGFGAIDLYQLAASRYSWWPQHYFRWTATDDVLHVVFGAALVIIGVGF
jgi:tryptophan-rich sensory protein